MSWSGARRTGTPELAASDPAATQSKPPWTTLQGWTGELRTSSDPPRMRTSDVGQPSLLRPSLPLHLLSHVSWRWLAQTTTVRVTRRVPPHDAARSHTDLRDGGWEWEQDGDPRSCQRMERAGKDTWYPRIAHRVNTTPSPIPSSNTPPPTHRRCGLASSAAAAQTASSSRSVKTPPPPAQEPSSTGIASLTLFRTRQRQCARAEGETRRMSRVGEDVHADRRPHNSRQPPEPPGRAAIHRPTSRARGRSHPARTHALPPQPRGAGPPAPRQTQARTRARVAPHPSLPPEGPQPVRG